MIELHSQREPEPKRGSSPVCPRIQSGRASERSQHFGQPVAVVGRALSDIGSSAVAAAGSWAPRSRRRPRPIKAAFGATISFLHIYAALLSRVPLRSPPLALALLGGRPGEGGATQKGNLHNAPKVYQ